MRFKTSLTLKECALAGPQKSGLTNDSNLADVNLLAIIFLFSQY